LEEAIVHGLRRAVLLTLTAAACLAAAAPAGADKPIKEPGVNLDANFPAGVACAGFPVSVHVEMDKTSSKLFFDKDGNPIRAQATGDLVLTVSNAATGESRTLNVSGATHITFEPDRIELTLTGHGLLILFPTDVPPGPSTTLTTGQMTFAVTPDGVFTLLSTVGNVTDLCAELA
jgi:hypothetical protein